MTLAYLCTFFVDTLGFTSRHQIITVSLFALPVLVIVIICMWICGPAQRRLSHDCGHGTTHLKKEQERRKMLRRAQYWQHSNHAAAYQTFLLRHFLKCHANLAGNGPGDAGMEQLMTKELLWCGLL